MGVAGGEIEFLVIVFHWPGMFGEGEPAIYWGINLEEIWNRALCAVP